MSDAKEEKVKGYLWPDLGASDDPGLASGKAINDTAITIADLR